MLINMSQVKKFQVGGKFRMNGREISGQRALDNLAAAYAGSDPSERGMWNVAQRAIQDGYTAQYNNGDNSIQVFDLDGNDVTSKYTDTKASTTDKGIKRFFDSIGENEAHRFKKSGRYMSLVDMNDTGAAEPTPDKLKLNRGSGWWEYTKDKDGNNVYINGVNNEAKMNILHGIRTYFDDANPETLADRYDLTGWDKSLMDAFAGMYGKVENKDDYWNQLQERIKAGKTTPEDDQLLTSWGFVKPGTSNAGAGAGSGTKEKPLGVPQGWTGSPGAATNSGLGIEKRNDGHYYVYGDPRWTTGAFYLKDYDWAKGTPFENGVLYNSRLYTEDEVFDNNNDTRDYAMQAALTPFINAWRDQSLSWNDRWNAARQSGVHWFNEDNNLFEGNVNPNAGWTENWSRYFADNGLGEGDYSIVDASNMFTNAGDNQIIAYINNSDKTNRNRYGIDNVRYLVRDGAGNVVKYNDLDALTSGAGLTINSDIYGSPVRNLDYHPYDSINGNDFAVYKQFTSGNQTNTIYVGKDGYLYWAKRDQNGKLMNPKKIYDANTMQDILSNPDKYAKDINKWYSKVTMEPISTGEYFNPIHSWPWIFSHLDNYIRPNQNGINARQQNNLPRYQWGGPIQGVKNNIISPKITDAITDVSGSHAIDGSQGGLTDDEKKLIAAAAGDLVGVGLTFVPVYGNIAGAATGAAASLTRFSANKELGVNNPGLKLAGDLALDMASIIPIVGTGAKAAKAASTIRAAAKPIMKLLAISGAAAPVVTAVQKVASGEKYTSEDLAEAIRGIGSAVIAGNLISQDIGNAKLAASKAKSFAEADAKGLRKSEVTLEGGKKYTDQSSIDDLKQFIKDNPTEKKAIEAVISTAKSQNVTLNEAQARSLLEQQGITFEKGSIKWRANPLKKGSGFGRRQDATLELQTPEVRSAMRYYFDPFKRADVLGSKAVFGFGKKQGLLGDTTAEELSAALKRLQTGKTAYESGSASKAVDKALLRMSAYEPQAFGDLLRVDNKTYLPVESTRNRGELIFGGQRYYRLPVNPGGQLESPEVRLLPPHVEPSTPITQQLVPRPTYTQLGARPVYTELGARPSYLQLNGPADMYRPSINRPVAWTAGRYPGIVLDTPTPIIVGSDGNFLMLKSGGKIRKAQDGLDTEKIRPIEPLFDLKNSKLWQTMNNQTITVNTPDPILAQQEKRMQEQIAAHNSEQNARIKNKGGIWDEIDFNKANLNDMMRGVVGAKMIYQDLQDSLKSNAILKTRQFITPQLAGPSYDFSDIQRKYNLAKEPLLTNKFVSNDNFANLAYKLGLSESLKNLNMQKGAEESARVMQTNDQRRAVDNQNTVARAQTANEKSNYITQLEARDPMLRVQARDFLHANILGPLGQQFGQQIRDEQNLRNQLLLEQSFGQMSQAEKAALDAKLAKYKNEWINSAERSNGVDFEDYMSSNPERVRFYNEAMSAYQNNLNAKLAGIKLKNVWNQGADLMRVTRAGVYKSGGNVSVTVNNRNKYHRDVREQIAIDGNRNAQKNAQKLSDNLARLLQQLLSK